jgi:hypothetical protein
MKPPRITIRRMMAAVAVAGILLGLEHARRHRARCLEIAALHESLEHRHMRVASLTDMQAWRYRVRAGQIRDASRLGPGAIPDVFATGDGSKPEDPDTLDDRAEDCDLQASREREEAVFRGRLRAKYERAAWHPWLAIEPDSPGPR